jgi:hypothetical protein
MCRKFPRKPRIPPHRAGAHEKDSAPLTKRKNPTDDGHEREKSIIYMHMLENDIDHPLFFHVCLFFLLSSHVFLLFFTYVYIWFFPISSFMSTYGFSFSSHMDFSCLLLSLRFSHLPSSLFASAIYSAHLFAINDNYGLHLIFRVSYLERSDH